MEWPPGEHPGIHPILEYDARINDVLPSYEMITVCAYDITKFSASFVMDVLRTHPRVVVGGVLREDPLYMPPDQFLQELSQRRSQGTDLGASAGGG
jgi:hypothetical protein